jgi:hypothetical protein
VHARVFNLQITRLVRTRFLLSRFSLFTLLDCCLSRELFCQSPIAYSFFIFISVDPPAFGPDRNLVPVNVMLCYVILLAG